MKVKWLAALALFSGSVLAQDKPNIWIQSDFTDPRDVRVDGHPRSDPDDMAALASLLLSADRFHIESIVLGSSTHKNSLNPLEIINEIYVPAYQKMLAKLPKTHGFQPTINYQWSSITSSPNQLKLFDPQKDYFDLAGYETVQSLVDYARNNKVYLLIWGQLSEAAIAVKHLQSTSQLQVLENITIIAHWSKSFIKSMYPEMATNPLMVSNSVVDMPPAVFLHEQAAKGKVKLIQLGSVGQTGLVDGSLGFALDDFENSALGQIFVGAKSYKNRPDQSDAATFWALATDLGFKIDSYPQNGDLSKASELKDKDKFFKQAPVVMADLLKRSNMAQGDKLPASLLAKYFTYGYFMRGTYAIYTPTAVNFRILDKTGKLVKQGKLNRWSNKIELAEQPRGSYKLQLLFVDKIVEKLL